MARACDASEVGEPPCAGRVGPRQLLVWNTLMAHEHPRGAGPFAALSCVIWSAPPTGGSESVGIAASARRLKARDVWIGRRAPAHPPAPGGGAVPVPESPHVEVPQSGHVLGRAARAVRIASGYRPWLLETFATRRASGHELARGLGAGREQRARTPRPCRARDTQGRMIEPAWRERLDCPMTAARTRPARQRVLGGQRVRRRRAGRRG